LNWRYLTLAILAGLVFSAIINSATHTFLFDLFNTNTSAEAAPDTTGTILQILVVASIAIILAPLSEEIANRGLLFAEADSLPRIQLFLWSILVFALMHILAGGTAKVLAVMPMAVLFVAVRQFTGHWIYSAAAHAAVNLVAGLAIRF
jgi:membrane protease YdiL (CAAX protease family)